MKKNKQKKALIFGFVFVLTVVLLIILINYVYTNVKWASYNLPGLKFTEQEKGTKYFGEKYSCNNELTLYIEIKGSLNNVRDRNVQIKMIDTFGREAGAVNMKLREVNENQVSYADGENILVIDKNNVATFLINDMPVLENCRKK